MSIKIESQVSINLECSIVKLVKVCPPPPRNQPFHIQSTTCCYKVKTIKLFQLADVWPLTSSPPNKTPFRRGQNKEIVGICMGPWLLWANDSHYLSQLAPMTQTPRQARDTIEKQSRDNLLVYAQIRMGNSLGDNSSNSHCQRRLK